MRFVAIKQIIYISAKFYLKKNVYETGILFILDCLVAALCLEL